VHNQGLFFFVIDLEMNWENHKKLDSLPSAVSSFVNKPNPDDPVTHGTLSQNKLSSQS